MGQTDKQNDQDPEDRLDFNDCRWWLTPEEEDAAEERSWRLAEYLARRLKPKQAPSSPPHTSP